MPSRPPFVHCATLYALAGACLSPPSPGDITAELTNIEGIYTGVDVPRAGPTEDGSAAGTTPSESSVATGDDVPTSTTPTGGSSEPNASTGGSTGTTGSTGSTSPANGTSTSTKSLSTGFWMQSMDRPDLCVAAVSADGNARCALRLVTCADDERQLFTAAMATSAFFCLQPNRRCLRGAIDPNIATAQTLYITQPAETGYTFSHPLLGSDPLYPQTTINSKDFAVFYNPANVTGADLFFMSASATESATAKKLNVMRANSAASAGFTIRSATNLSVCLTDRSGALAAEPCVKGDARQRWNTPLYGAGGTGTVRANKANTVKLVSGSNRCVWAPLSTQRPTTASLGSCSDANALLQMGPANGRGLSVVRSDGDVSVANYLTMDPTKLLVQYQNSQSLSLSVNYTMVAGGYD